jgi:hypothetical protein
MSTSTIKVMIGSKNPEHESLLDVKFYVLPTSCMDFLKYHIETNFKTESGGKVQAHVLDTPTSTTKFQLCTKVGFSSQNHAYIGFRDYLSESSIHYINRVNKKGIETWNIFLMFSRRIYTFNWTKKMWGEFMENLDLFWNLTKSKDSLKKKVQVKLEARECVVCFGNKDLIKCLKCTSRYCFDCFTKDSIFDCFSCGLKMGYDHRHGKIRALSNHALDTQMGCFFKILEIKFGVDMQPLFTHWNSKQLAEILLELHAKQIEGVERYFDMNRYILTADLQKKECCSKCAHMHKLMEASKSREKE